MGLCRVRLLFAKSLALSDASELFEDGRKRRQRDEVSDDELFEQIGRLKMELEWLKKKASLFD